MIEGRRTKEANNGESVGVRGEECEKEKGKGKKKGGKETNIFCFLLLDIILHNYCFSQKYPRKKVGISTHNYDGRRWRGRRGEGTNHLSGNLLGRGR